MDEKIITYVDSLTEKQVEDFAKMQPPKPVNMGEFHEFGKTKHNLITFIFKFPIGMWVEAKWSRCPECREVRNFKVMGIDKKTNTTYEKIFVRHGKREI